MAKLEQRPRVELDVTLRLSEVEARALEALAGYGSKAFLEVFYKHMGRHYLEPHEAGLVSLLDSVRRELPPVLERATLARKAFVQGVSLGPAEGGRDG